MASAILEFVVLRHDQVDHPHFDLMFEITPGGKLATWRSAVWPIDQTTELVKLPDHRREYLEYQGPISRNRGRVRQVARGQYRREENGADWLVRFQVPMKLPPMRLCRIGSIWQAKSTKFSSNGRD